VIAPGTGTWPPLTEKQEARLAQWLEAVSPIFGATVHRHHLCWQYLDEARPGRGYDVQVVYLDGDSFVTMAMDPYGNGWDANGTVEVAHNSSDEECPCEGCEAEREAEL